MSHGDLTNGIEELPPRRELQEQVNVRAWRGLAAAALLLAALSVCLTVVLFWLYTSESTERRDGNCRSFEGDHADEVRDLEDRYQFLTATPRDGWAAVHKFAFATLPRVEADAARDDDQRGVFVPAYCDDPGVGLPEPDPCVPARPTTLNEGMPPVRVRRQVGRCRQLPPTG